LLARRGGPQTPARTGLLCNSPAPRLAILAPAHARLLKFKIKLKLNLLSCAQAAPRSPSVYKSAIDNKTPGGKVLIKFGFYRALAALIIVITALACATAAPARKAQQGGTEELVKKADDLYKAGKFREAIEAYKEVLAKDANNDQAIAYIGYSYNRLGDKESARQWMKRRVEMPGQTPSRKSMTLVDMALLYWDEAHLQIAASRAASLSPRSEGTMKMISEGIETAQKAVAIAPRSAKGFNLLNLLYRTSAAAEQDPAKQKELLTSADNALRQSIQIYEAIANPPTNDLFIIPTIMTIPGVDLGPAVKGGQAIKKASPDVMKDIKEPVEVEVLVGRDGRARFHRIVRGQGKSGEAALAVARQWEFEPATFEGHPVQILYVINFTAQ
jgi:tetratricopeptide (TPR) repeat protein